jgi:biopolymer transport protein ExbB/TolQ
MRVGKKRDIINILLILGVAIPGALYYDLHFYRLFNEQSAVGRNLCLIIIGVFLWGMADILFHYWAVMKESSQLEEFTHAFTDSSQTEKDLRQRFGRSIIGNRFVLISQLKNTLSEVSHEVLTDIISNSESRRALLAKYFLSICILLGLLGTFLGILESIRGTYVTLSMVRETETLIKSLHQPLHGISLAFGSSVVGIVSSLALGFAYLFFYQRQLSFLSDLEQFTQATLIPALTQSSGKILEGILKEIQGMRTDMEQFSRLGQVIHKEAERVSTIFREHYESLARLLHEHISQGVTNLLDGSAQSIHELVAGVRGTIRNQVETTHSLMQHQTEQYFQRMEALLAEARQSQQKIFDEYFQRWTVFSDQILKGTVREFGETLKSEREGREYLLLSLTQGGALFEKAGHLIQSNQAEMQATLAMFVEGVDKILQYFNQKAEHGESEKAFLQELETSLTLFHERTSSVLLEYTARSREILAGILENQILLGRKVNKLAADE